MNSKFPGPCDDIKWGRTELWDVFEAAHVLVDIEPSTDPDPHFEPEADALYKQLAMSVALGYPKIVQQIGNRHLFLPLQMIDWAIKKGYAVSEDLINEVTNTARMNIERLKKEKDVGGHGAEDKTGTVTRPIATKPADASAEHNAEVRADSVSDARPWPAALEDDDSPPDPVYEAIYKKAWALYDERDLWKRMEHRNDPDKFQKITENLQRIELELANLQKESEPFKPGLTPDPEVSGITKTETLRAFATPKNESTLKNAMEDGPKWVLPARVAKGGRGRGRGESQWHPVLLAVAIHERKLATVSQLDRAFARTAYLAPWREEWAEQSEAIRPSNTAL